VPILTRACCLLFTSPISLLNAEAAPDPRTAQPSAHEFKEKAMIKRSYQFALALALLYVTVGAQQFPIMDMVANKVIQKYQQSSCEQLWQERAEKQQGMPKPPQEQQAIQTLRNDPQMRMAFINKVAAPIANKMFECGMIP
jgi:hypothetical protein